MQEVKIFGLGLLMFLAGWQIGDMIMWSVKTVVPSCINIMGGGTPV
jgi:hypothetical protein